jgi:hypothetical protein
VKYLIGLLCLCASAYAQTPPEHLEHRFCGPPGPSAPAVTALNASTRAAFQRTFRCPSTQQATGACPGWVMDWVIPLWAGGCYSVINMQWLPQSFYTCDAMTGENCKRRWEGMVYVFTQPAIPAPVAPEP